MRDCESGIDDTPVEPAGKCVGETRGGVRLHHEAR